MPPLAIPIRSSQPQPHLIPRPSNPRRRRPPHVAAPSVLLRRVAALRITPASVSGCPRDGFLFFWMSLRFGPLMLPAALLPSARPWRCAGRHFDAWGAEPPGAPCFRLLVLLWRLAWRSPARLRLHHVVSGWDALCSSTTRQQDSLSSSASLRQHHAGSGKVAPSYAWFLGHPKDELKNILLLATQIKIRFTWPNAPFFVLFIIYFFFDKSVKWLNIFEVAKHDHKSVMVMELGQILIRYVLTITRNIWSRNASIVWHPSILLSVPWLHVSS